MPRIPINPELLTWARERAGLESLALAGQPRSGSTTPTEGPHE